MSRSLPVGYRKSIALNKELSGAKSVVETSGALPFAEIISIMLSGHLTQNLACFGYKCMNTEPRFNAGVIQRAVTCASMALVYEKMR